MYQQMKLFTEPEELLAWVALHHPDFRMDGEAAGILLNYMKGHDYCVGTDNIGDMIRVSVLEEQEAAEEYSLTEMIDVVAEWNYELIQEADRKRKDPKDFIEFVNELARYESLLEEEQKLAPLIEQTVYGKKIDLLARQLAEALISSMESEKKLDECVQTVAAFIRNRATDKEKCR